MQTTVCPSETAKLSKLLVSTPDTLCFFGISLINSLIFAIVFIITFRKSACPNPSGPGSELGSTPSLSNRSRNNANAHSLSVPPLTPKNHLSASESANVRLTYFHPPMLPLCMNISVWCWNGWQLLSESVPSVVARTCANMRFEQVFDARRSRFSQFQAGRVEVKMHGSGPSLGSV